MKDNLTQEDIVKEFFTSHPNQSISHPMVVDWVVEEWKKERVRFLETRIG